MALPTMTMNGPSTVHVWAFDFAAGKRCEGGNIDLSQFPGQRVRIFMDPDGHLSATVGKVGPYYTILGEIDVPLEEHEPDPEDPEGMIPVEMQISVEDITRYDKPA